jgi:hypothetical protein
MTDISSKNLIKKLDLCKIKYLIKSRDTCNMHQYSKNVPSIAL